MERTRRASRRRPSYFRLSRRTGQPDDYKVLPDPRSDDAEVGDAHGRAIDFAARAWLSDDMSNPFAGLGIDVAAVIGSVVGQYASVPATLTKMTPGAYNPSNPAGGNNAAKTDYACRVLMTEFVERLLKDDLVREVTGTIVVLLATVTGRVVPSNGDSITLVPPVGTSRVFVVDEKIVIDAAGATAECGVKG